MTRARWRSWPQRSTEHRSNPVQPRRYRSRIRLLRPPGKTTENPAAGGPTPAETIDLGEAVRTPTPEIPPTETPRPTFTPRPSATPPRVLDAPFSLVSRTEVCDGRLPAAHIAVRTPAIRRANLSPGSRSTSPGTAVPTRSTPVLVPEIGLGYADYQMQPDLTYSLRAGNAGDLVSDLSIPACGGAWLLEFQEGAQ